MSTDRATTPIRRPVHLALAFLILCAVAIQAFGVQPTAAAGIPTLLEISANPPSIPIGGSSEVTATILDENGDAIPNLTLQFVRNPITLGTLSATSGVSDSNGQVKVTFTSTSADGNVTVTSRVATATAVNKAVSITIQPAVVVDALDLTSTPTTILGDGVAQAQLTATATLGGVPLTNHTINFSTDLGSLSASSAQTNAEGKATVTLTSLLGGVAEVRAATAGGEITRILDVTILPNTASVVAVADPTNLIADGIQTATITATLTQGDNNQTPVPAGEVVTFTTDVGFFSNATQTITATTNAQGRAVALLQSVTGGTAQVSAAASNGESDSVSVNFTSVPVALGLVAVPNVVLANNTAIATISVTLLISDTLADNETITFTSSMGTLSVTTTQTIDGIATTTIRSNTEGIATIIATYGTTSNTTAVTFTPVASNVTTSGTPNEIRGNGFDVSVIRAVVKSAIGTPVANTPVTFTTSLGDLSVFNALTDANGVVTSTLTATSDVTATASVGASINTGASNSILVDILPSLTPAPPVIVSPSEGEFVLNRRPIITGTVTTGAGSVVDVFYGDSLTDRVCDPITVSADNTWSCEPTTDLLDGPVEVRARVTDTQNNPPSSRSTRNFTVDTTAPAAPEITSPITGTTTSSLPTISGEGEIGSTIIVTRGGEEICRTTVAADGSWSCQITTALPGGEITIAVTATDQAGNVSPETTRSFVVNVNAVSAPGFAPPLLVRTGTPTINGTADAGTTLTLVLTLLDASTVSYETTVSDTGTWSVRLATAPTIAGTFPTAGLSDGTYPLVAQARNGVGTPSRETPETLTVDLTAPPAPAIINLADNARVPERLFEVVGTAEAGSTVSVTFTLAAPAPVSAIVSYSAVADTGGNWRVAVDDVLPRMAPLTVIATATDLVGNTSVPTQVNFVITELSYLPVMVTRPTSGLPVTAPAQSGR